MSNSSTTRMKELYFSKYLPELLKELNLKNTHEAPRIEKVVLNIGLGRAKEDKKMIDVAANTLKKITGQQPIETFAKKSIATFKLREGMKIGLKVTLRGERMYEFLDRLITIVLPRVRDFHGVAEKAFDQQGNYSIGLVDQSVFPELTFEETTSLHGLQINIIIKSLSVEHSRALLEKFGLPFEKPLPPVAKPVHIEPIIEVEPVEDEVVSKTEDETSEEKVDENIDEVKKEEE